MEGLRKKIVEDEMALIASREAAVFRDMYVQGPVPIASRNVVEKTGIF